MDKMKFETPDMVAGNVEKIGAMFPNCVTEALDEERSTPDKPVYKKAINFELLRQMLSSDVVEGDEAYEFTWVGKKAAIVEANKPIRATLRPCPEESVNWDTTENLYIEGDNLQVLKLLQESYLGKVKMIYIDPPYNTGGDFIYRDSFLASAEDYNQELGLYNEEGEHLFRNTDANGRFHSDWCTMIYARLMLARNMLTDDGVIFISIDDNEIGNLREICDEVFGADNMICTFIWQKRYSAPPDTKDVGYMHENILMYKKSSSFKMGLLPFTEEQVERYKNPDNDPRGPWKMTDYTCRYTTTERPNLNYAIRNPNTGEEIWPKPTRAWAMSKEVHLQNEREKRIWWGEDGKNRTPALKNFLSDIKQGRMPWTLLLFADVGHTDEATKELRLLIPEIKFTPKPTRLLKVLIQVAGCKNGDIVLDFFSGSASTADAVLKHNINSEEQLRFIMVQIPEKCEVNTDAFRAGYHTICDIGKERIRRAGKKIREENPLTTQDLDIGFRVLKLDSTNMKDVYYNPADITQTGLLDMVSNIKEDRTDLDLLFGCLIDWGLPLSLPYTSEQIDGCTVHTYNDGDLIACFDTDIPDSVIRAIAKRKPLRAVFRDAGFANSPAKINVFEIFKLLAPDSSVRVI